MATSSIGSVVKIDDSTVKAFAEAMRKKSEPIQVVNKNMTPLTDFSVFKHVKDVRENFPCALACAPAG